MVVMNVNVRMDTSTMENFAKVYSTLDNPQFSMVVIEFGKYQERLWRDDLSVKNTALILVDKKF